MDKEMRFIFVIIGICILAGILCVVFAVTQNIKGGSNDAYIQEKSMVSH